MREGGRERESESERGGGRERVRASEGEGEGEREREREKERAPGPILFYCNFKHTHSYVLKIGSDERVNRSCCERKRSS